MAVESTPLVNRSEIAEIEMFILRRMKEFTLGDHASVFKGAGFNFVGIRDWEPGDRVSSITISVVTPWLAACGPSHTRWLRM